MFRNKKRAVILAVIAVAAVFAVNYLRHHYVVPVLMYHSVKPQVPQGNRLIVSSAAFDRQMEFLKRNHYNVVPLDEIVRLIRDKQPVPERTVALTFDDGYLDNYSVAFPVLKKYGLPATVFLIVNEIGRPGMLTWEQVSIMRDSGLISFGSHTLNHPYLIDVTSAEELKKELIGSRKVLEEKLGRPVNAFCYPAGGFNPGVRQAVIDAGYSMALATNPGRDFADDDLFAFKRLRISENAANLFVFWVESSGYYNMMRESKGKKKGKNKGK
ncbi:MAG: polysaccharide deacetylase family protein [Candidatus Omnitrophota bacterium]